MTTNKTRNLRIGLGVFVLGILIFAALAYIRQPFSGEFDNVGMYQVKGDVLQIKSFDRDGKFKFLVEFRVEGVQKLQGEFVGGDASLPEQGDVIRFDSPDSRLNLVVEQPPVCHKNEWPNLSPSDWVPVIVCEYSVELDEGNSAATFVIMEQVSDSSGMPEPIGILE